MASLRGSFHEFVLYDVSEQIRLDRLREILGAEPPRREPSFKHPTPEYVRFERPPVVEHAPRPDVPSDSPFSARIKYYDYGIVSVEFLLPFETDWDGLIQLASRWVAAPELEEAASRLLSKRLETVRPALIDPYESWLSEDYCVIHLSEALDDAGAHMPAAHLLQKHGGDIVQLIRGESAELSNEERKEVLQPTLSYYPSDFMVVGWSAAVIYDTPEGAAPAIQLLEYANTQLLEFRHYDEVLTRVLEEVYRTLEHKGGIFRRWRLARKAERLGAIRLEVTDLTERSDNAIKFLSDMFYARAYKMAAGKIGVTDYRTLVEGKLKTAGDLYAFIMNEFHQARAFVLEAAIVAILIVDLIILFRGDS